MGGHVEAQSYMRWGAVVVSRLRLRSPGAAPDTWRQGLYAGDALGTHLGVQCVTVRDGEDGEDGKGGGGGMEGGRLGSRAWRCWVSSHRPGGFLDGHGGRGNVLGRAHVQQMVRACTMHGPWEV